MSGADQDALRKFLSYLDADPVNASLLAEAARVAHAAGEDDTAEALLRRFEAIEPLTPALENLRGLIALRRREYSVAVDAFAAARRLDDQAAVRFNEAWALAALGRSPEAVRLIDQAVLDTAPGAAALLVQALHRAGDPALAVSEGQRLAGQGRSDPEFLAAIALAARDAAMDDLARQFASAALDQQEAQTVLGELALDEPDAEAALAHFDRALALSPNAPRALAGLGMALLLKGDGADGHLALRRAAEAYGDDAWSWSASGWAALLAGDLAAAEHEFEQATASLDGADGDVLAGAALTQFLLGRREKAAELSGVALSHDPASEVAVLVASLLQRGAPPADAGLDRGSVEWDPQLLAQVFARFSGRGKSS